MPGEAAVETITETDLDVIEKLAEQELGEGLRRHLLKVFGPCGERFEQDQYATGIYKECLKRHGRCRGCGMCGADHPLLQGSLLSLIAKAVNDANAGRLDPVSGQHRIGWSDSCYF